MDPIRLFVPKFRTEEILDQIRECLEQGWTGLGYKTLEFEEAWKNYTGLPHAHFLNSATAGLHLALRLLKKKDGWREGDEIISTPLTFVSTNHVIHYEQLEPVFADVDKYLCLEPRSVEERIGPRTRAVIFMGMGGNAGRLEEVSRLCRLKGLRLILDGAHMAGTRLHGQHVGSEADISVFSFHAVKNLPSADAGIICCQDGCLDAEARRLTWLGISRDTYSRTIEESRYKWRYDVDEVGFKYHGNSVMAAMCLVGLKYLEEDNAYRRQVASWYDELLKEKIRMVSTAPGCEPSRHLYQVLVEDRDGIMLALNEKHIYPGVHYRDNSTYPMYAHTRGECPRSLAASYALISLPLYVGLSYDQVSRVSRELNQAVCLIEKERSGEATD